MSRDVRLRRLVADRFWIVDRWAASVVSFLFSPIEGLLLMCIFRFFHARRFALAFGLIGVMVLAAGCGGGEQGAPTASAIADSKAREDSEREARLKAFGPKGTGNPTRDQANPPKDTGTKPTEAAKP